MRVNYWSCSALADWIRGTVKPDSATSEDWQHWRQQARQRHPLRFWISEEGLDLLQDFLTWPKDQLVSLRYYVNNRWISRSHALTASRDHVKPGEWQDLGWRMLPCMFNELRDFVEVEQAWHHVVWDAEAQQRFRPPWYRTWLGLRGWRCAEAGLAYLDWASSLRVDESWGHQPGDAHYGELTYQAKAAQEIKELYLWWTQVYPNRPDAHETSGWSDICEQIRESNGGDVLGSAKDSRLEKKKNRALKLLKKIEQQYEKEDTEMLTRLIRVRHSLWT